MPRLHDTSPEPGPQHPRRRHPAPLVSVAVSPRETDGRHPAPRRCAGPTQVPQHDAACGRPATGDRPARPAGLHGRASSSQTWASVLPLLGAHANVIVPDLLGHGRSAKPPSATTRSAPTPQASATSWSLWYRRPPRSRDRFRKRPTEPHRQPQIVQAAPADCAYTQPRWRLGPGASRLWSGRLFNPSWGLFTTSVESCVRGARPARRGPARGRRADGQPRPAAGCCRGSSGAADRTRRSSPPRSVGPPHPWLAR